MKTVTKSLLAAALVGPALLAGATLQASPSQNEAVDQHHSGGMMSGGPMMGQGSGPMMGEDSGGMMGMMQQMSRMMNNCNEMMEAHGDAKRDAEETSKPAG